MPLSYRIDTVLGVLFTRVTGNLSSGEVLAWMEQLRADPDYRSDLTRLHDCRGLVSLFSTDELRRFADSIEIGFDCDVHPRSAIVVDREASFGIARVFEVLTAHLPITFRAFRNLAEARAWLGLPPEPESA